MNKTELIETVSKNTKITKVQTELILNSVFETIQKTLSKQEEVKIQGFGTFSIQNRKAKTGRNLKTGEAVVIPACIIPKFKPSKELKLKVTSVRKK